METITFSYEGTDTQIKCHKNEKMKEICDRYAKSLHKEFSEISFLNDDGNEINDQLTLNELFKELEKKNNDKLNITVKNIDLSLDSSRTNKNKKISSEIICPQCGENAFINIKNYKIDLFGCKNNHNNKNILINDFQTTQYIIPNKIKCGFCNKPNNEKLYFCLECKRTLCLLCYQKHDKKHKIINCNYICLKHNEQFISYCDKCKKNICFMCEAEHSSHEIIDFGKKIPQKNIIVNELNFFKVRLDRFKSYLKEIIENINKTIKNMEILYEIMKNIINNFDSKNRNYQNFQNISQIYIDLNNISEDINQIINEESIKNKINKILQIYKKMNNIEDEDSEIENNTILINYEINQSNEIKIFGKEFVINNEKICNIIYENKEYPLTETFSDFDRKKKKLTIKLEGINNIINMSQMFYECKSLLSIKYSTKCDTSKVTSMRSMFNGCTSLKKMIGISNFDTSNVTDMYCMFYECRSLIFMPDISNWDTSKVNNMSGMFERCSSLIALPDISKWNTKNVRDISSMFKKCSMLSFLPDISNWDISNVTDNFEMLKDCKKTLNIPDKFKNMN